MSASLFDLVGEYKELYAMLTDEDYDETIVKDTLDAVIGEIEVKAEGCVALIDRLDMEMTACKKQKEQWDKAYNTRKNAIENLKKRITDAMMQMDKKEIKTETHLLKLQKNGGVAPLVIDGDVPQNLCKVTVEPDKEKIREYISKNEDCKFAHIGERGVSLRIKVN